MYEYRITIDRVVDGDTVDCWIDLGYHTQVHKRIRFIGFNAPESRTRDKAEKAKGLKAKNWLKEEIDPSFVHNRDKVFILKSWGLGKYGRVLGEIFVQTGKSKKSITKTMISKGLGVKYDGGKR
tara:strand:+ start:3617 stop:3988 length:372 start_codon:yes stop_codon:yes gene_type:complete